MLPKVLQMNVHTYVGRNFVGELAGVNWAILPETRPGRAAATAAGGQAPVCAVHLSNPMEEGTADNIAVVSWLFRAIGGYDKRFALSFPNDFLARVQMVGTLSFACSPASGVDIPSPGRSQLERDRFRLLLVKQEGTVSEMRDIKRMSDESLSNGIFLRNGTDGSQAPSRSSASIYSGGAVDLVLHEVAGGLPQLPEISDTGPREMWGGGGGVRRICLSCKKKSKGYPWRWEILVYPRIS